MSGRVTTFDEPKKYLDDEEVFDVIDDLRRYIDKLKKKIKSQRQQLDQDIDLMEYQRRDYRELQRKVLLELLWAERE